MFPVLISYKFLTIGGYGIMLGLAFYLGFLLLERELKLRDKDPDLAYRILMSIIPAAIVGAKIFHIFENPEEFFRDPRGMILSGAGLTVYGGFIFSFLVATLVIIYSEKLISRDEFLKISKIVFAAATAATVPLVLLYKALSRHEAAITLPLGLLIVIILSLTLGLIALNVIIVRKHYRVVLEVFDITAPAMALGYGIGRLGCHVAGDGCYGELVSKFPMWSFLGTAYPNGFVPISLEVFPTPLFESFFSLMLFLALMQLRKKESAPGTLFFGYLIFNGLSRFLVEFIRINPKFVLGLTHAQVLAVLFILTGVLGFVLTRKKNRPAES